MFDSKFGINRFKFDFQLKRFLSSLAQIFEEKKDLRITKKLTDGAYTLKNRLV